MNTEFKTMCSPGKWGERVRSAEGNSVVFLIFTFFEIKRHEANKAWSKWGSMLIFVEVMWLSLMLPTKCSGSLPLGPMEKCFPTHLKVKEDLETGSSPQPVSGRVLSFWPYELIPNWTSQEMKFLPACSQSQCGTPGPATRDKRRREAPCGFRSWRCGGCQWIHNQVYPDGYSWAVGP